MILLLISDTEATQALLNQLLISHCWDPFHQVKMTHHSGKEGPRKEAGNGQGAAIPDWTRCFKGTIFILKTNHVVVCF